jgi:hypothetical protein
MLIRQGKLPPYGKGDSGVIYHGQEDRKGAYLSKALFDTNGATEVRIRYAEIICNDFGLLSA